ncbi:DUF4157 domain-containing protein [Nocardioides litoris]|uniref:eCIS core domain-containing protein n=1 Tax=Nocardioides litoris TaxID=1926648 RepID=UPI00112460BF|nr:DUF4157 domain-containing protein [Nocardioides litoris]
MTRPEHEVAEAKPARAAQLSPPVPEVAEPTVDVGAEHHPSVVAGLRRTAGAAGGGDELGGTTLGADLMAPLRRRAGKGAPLDAGTATDLGGRLGADFSGVRVHADGEADTIARSVQATAFTLGNDIYFSKGTYNPSSRAGRSLLAHELTHVRQHREGRSTTASGTGGGVQVGRVDDPAEREAEAVARAVDTGRPVPGAGTTTEPLAAHSTCDPCAHRSVSLDGLSIRRTVEDKVTMVKDRVPATEVPLAIVELTSVIREIQDKKGAAEKLGGMWTDAKVDTVADSEGFSGTSNPIGVVDGAAGFVKAGFDAHTAYGNIKQGTNIDKNLGWKQAEDAVLGGLGGGGKVVTGVANTVKVAGGPAGEWIPGVEAVVNLKEGYENIKGSVEDGVTAAKLQGDKRSIKRQGDKFLPLAVREKRFAEFIEALKSDGKVKSDDRKRWATVRQAWDAHVGGPNRPAGDYAGAGTGGSITKPGALEKKWTSFKSLFSSGPAPATPAGPAFGTATGGAFDPLTSNWADSGVHTVEKRMFLEWLETTTHKDFGYGTNWRSDATVGTVVAGTAAVGDATEQSARTDRDTAAQAKLATTRGLGKVTNFAQNRLTESSAVKGVKGVGNTLDGTGTFTAGADGGATKAAGKAVKLAAATYEAVKKGYKRWNRVTKLAEVRDEAGYGPRVSRDWKWKVARFVGTDIDKAMAKTKTAINHNVEEAARLKKHGEDTAAFQADQQARAAHATYVQQVGTRDAKQAQNQQDHDAALAAWQATNRKKTDEKFAEDKAAFDAYRKKRETWEVQADAYQHFREQQLAWDDLQNKVFGYYQTHEGPQGPEQDRELADYEPPVVVIDPGPEPVAVTDPGDQAPADPIDFGGKPVLKEEGAITPVAAPAAQAVSDPGTFTSGSGPAKKASKQLDAATAQAMLARLTKKCVKMVSELVLALQNPDKRVRQLAQDVVLTIANGDLAGAVFSVTADDLEALLTTAEPEKSRLLGQLQARIEGRLGGVGG